MLTQHKPIKRTGTIKRTGFKSAFVRHTPFAPKSTLQRKVAIQGGEERGNVPSATVASGIKVSTGIRRVGKKGQEWITVRAWLKRHFNFAGIIYCEARLEGCWLDSALSFAHCRKRRKLLEGEMYHVALLCQPCHNTWEILPHEEMHKKIHGIIDRRGLICPTK